MSTNILQNRDKFVRLPLISDEEKVLLKEAKIEGKETTHFEGSHFRFVVLVGGRPIGVIDAKVTAENGQPPLEAEVSYILAPEARGRGYAARAINLVGEFLREHRVHRAVMRFPYQKRDYLRAPERCGFAELDTEDTVGGKMVLFAREL